MEQKHSIFGEYYTVKDLYKDLKNLIEMGFENEPILIFFKDQYGKNYITKLKAITESTLNVKEYEGEGQSVIQLYNSIKAKEEFTKGTIANFIDID